MKITKLHVLLFVASLMLFACEGNNDINLNDLAPRNPVQQARSTKRGFSFNTISVPDVLMLGNGCVWAYNWGVSANAAIGALFGDLEMDFCPMGWSGLNADAVRAYVAAHPNTKYLLGMNEPNLTDQANMTPAQAAERWQDYVDLSKELNLKLISPALNYGTLTGYNDPIVWLDEFFTLVNPDDIHGIAIHAYMNSGGGMKSFIDRFRKYGKPIWFTELACNFNPRPSVQQQIALMNDICNYMESDLLVERYAWFMLRGGPQDVNNALANNQNPPQLTQLGTLYNALSSQDKNVWYVENQTVEAEKYSSINCAESVGQEGFEAIPAIRITTDVAGFCDMTGLKEDTWLEYQIDVPATGTYRFQLRYSVALDSEMDLLINGNVQKTLSLTRSADVSTTWVTLEENLPLQKGQHTLRLSVTQGSCAINWLRFAIPE